MTPNRQPTTRQPERTGNAARNTPTPKTIARRLVAGGNPLTE